MLKKTLFVIFFILALTVSVSACSAKSTPTPIVIVEPTSPPQTGNLPQTEADVPRVSVEQARIAFEAGTAIIVDVRSAESFATGHIVGAISIPLTQIESDPGSVKLDKNQWIITYCT
jgi:3-mercaptopyruvate sulfurtransferase SseA